MSTVRVSKTRMTLCYVLVVVGILLAIVSLLANYVRREALDTSQFKDTSAALINDPEIQAAVASELVAGLYSNVDVQAQLEQKLPQDLQALAGPIAGASRELAERAANRLLERPRFQQVFVNASGLAHQELIDALEDNNKALRTTNGNVVLDLRPLVVDLGTRFNIVSNLADRIPPDAARIQILQSNELGTVQNLVQALKVVANWIWVLMLAAWALAVWLVPGRRRRALLSISVGLVITAIAVLVIRSLGSGYLVDKLVAADTYKPAVTNALAIVTQSLADAAWSLLILGVLATAGFWLVGPDAHAVRARRWMAPHLARGGVAYGIFAIVFLLFVWLAPLLSFRNVLIVAVLGLIGFELFRRQTAREVAAEVGDAVPPPPDEAPTTQGGATPAT